VGPVSESALTFSQGRSLECRVYFGTNVLDPPYILARNYDAIPANSFISLYI
jgi:hypothetical protein